MTDPIRTPSEALEAAAKLQRANAGRDPRTVEAMILGLSARIAVPDDETLVKDLAKHMSKSHACDWPCEDPTYCECIEEAAQAVKFLREAGALR